MLGRRRRVEDDSRLDILARLARAGLGTAKDFGTGPAWRPSSTAPSWGAETAERTRLRCSQAESCSAGNLGSTTVIDGSDPVRESDLCSAAADCIGDPGLEPQDSEDAGLDDAR
mmetsp:Transcript_49520/g.105909  ORF Transcript_49520/g.105909 Transcript_49520/m.105909 type:complete len:114 (-) Transcript_49520:248-589(-)